MPPEPPVDNRWVQRFRRLRRAGILLICAAYLLATVYFGLRHVLGDSLSHPLAYFFTWDMFPGYQTESSRRMVVGFTEPADKQDDKVRAVQLLPAADSRFRRGIRHDASWLDFDRDPKILLPAIEREMKRYNAAHPNSPVRQVLVVDRYWPSRFNLPDDLYEAQNGETNPRRFYWRHEELRVRRKAESRTQRSAADASHQ